MFGKPELEIVRLAQELHGHFAEEAHPGVASRDADLGPVEAFALLDLELGAGRGFLGDLDLLAVLEKEIDGLLERQLVLGDRRRRAPRGPGPGRFCERIVSFRILHHAFDEIEKKAGGRLGLGFLALEQLHPDADLQGLDELKKLVQVERNLFPGQLFLRTSRMNSP